MRLRFIALITRPVYKANYRERLSNHRPISGLSCFSKILEKVMYERIVRFLDKHDILFKNQYGFRAGKSAQQGILELTDKISLEIEWN